MLIYSIALSDTSFRTNDPFVVKSIDAKVDKNGNTFYQYKKDGDFNQTYIYLDSLYFEIGDTIKIDISK